VISKTSKKEITMTTYNLIYGKFDVKVECERCGEIFTYTHFLQTNVSNVQGATLYLNSIPKLNETIQALESERDDIIHKNKGLNAHKCPKCGYYQSWMEEGLKKQLILYLCIGVTAVSAIGTFVAAAISWGWGNILLLIGSAATVGIIAWFITYLVSFILVMQFYKRKLTIKKINLPQLEWQKILTMNGEPLK